MVRGVRVRLERSSRVWGTRPCAPRPRRRCKHSVSAQAQDRGWAVALAGGGVGVPSVSVREMRDSPTSTSTNSGTSRKRDPSEEPEQRGDRRHVSVSLVKAREGPYSLLKGGQAEERGPGRGGPSRPRRVAGAGTRTGDTSSVPFVQLRSVNPR